MDVLTQGFAVDELHGDKRHMILLANVVDGADARVVESRSGVGFAAKTLQSLGVLGHAVGKKFQGDSTVESGVLGLVDHTHSAGTEFLQNAKVRNGTVNHEGARAPRCRRCRSRSSRSQSLVVQSSVAIRFSPLDIGWLG